jgi:hypothetical protein
MKEIKLSTAMVMIFREKALPLKKQPRQPGGLFPLKSMRIRALLQTDKEADEARIIAVPVFYGQP